MMSHASVTATLARRPTRPNIRHRLNASDATALLAMTCVLFTTTAKSK